jgi:sugar phosphate isomerase/epimerase
VKKISRRQFVETTAAIAILGIADRAAFCNPLGLPLGIQLYSVREQMLKDLDEALASIRVAGYVEVEAAALPKKSAREIRASLDKAGLRCVSAHHPLVELNARFDEIVTYDKELGVHFIVCSSPGHRIQPTTGKQFSLDDWHYTAERLNFFGEKAATLNVRVGYHNHTPEFAFIDGKMPFSELLRLTDPKKVTFELDCGWALVAGVRPAEIMKDNPNRISMLHVKDFNLSQNPSPEISEPTVTELGKGTVDYRPIFAQAAKSQHIQHAFVEQEAFDMPWKGSLKVDADYMRNFRN